MLHNGCKVITVGIKEKVRLFLKKCLVRGNIRKWGDIVSHQEKREVNHYTETNKQTNKHEQKPGKEQVCLWPVV